MAFIILSSGGVILMMQTVEVGAGAAKVRVRRPACLLPTINPMVPKGLIHKAPGTRNNLSEGEAQSLELAPPPPGSLQFHLRGNPLPRIKPEVTSSLRLISFVLSQGHRYHSEAQCTSWGVALPLSPRPAVVSLGLPPRSLPLLAHLQHQLHP